MIVGQTLGGLELRRRLGKGGVGDVYLGFDTHLHRDVAIKALRPEFAHDPAFVRRFVSEAQNLARLNHPNIATLYSLYNDGHELCMVMEYIDGQTLDEIAPAISLSEADVMAVAAQAMEGLQYAHAMGLIHRDIKPGNLMINCAGMLKIMDFGIARLQGSERMTRQGAIIGSIAYMAPEQILGREGDERSDIYSLAIVLYELLCGAPPFAGDSEYVIMKAQIEAPPRRLLEHLPTVHPDLEAALMKALAKTPEDRFPSIADFRGALASVMINAFDAVRLLNGRFAGRREAPADEGADNPAAAVPETRLPGSSSVRRGGARSAAKVPAETTVQHGPTRRSDEGSTRRELWPRLALGTALAIFAVTFAVLTWDMTGTESGAPPAGPVTASTGPTAAIPPSSEGTSGSKVESRQPSAAPAPPLAKDAEAPTADTGLTTSTDDETSDAPVNDGAGAPDRRLEPPPEIVDAAPTPLPDDPPEMTVNPAPVPPIAQPRKTGHGDARNNPWAGSLDGQ